MADRGAKDRRTLVQVLVVALLVVGYAAFGAYMHLALQIHIVYTHAAYVPIVLAGMWWGRRGLVVAGVVACLPSVPRPAIPRRISMRKAPKGFRCHIGLFGRRNVGRAGPLTAVPPHQVSIVSDYAGTTTDPVEKPMELLPLGPVLFVDTAGMDDLSALGEKRVDRTRQVFDRTDVGVIVTAAGDRSDFEEQILGELRRREVPVVVVLNKVDQSEPCRLLLSGGQGARAARGTGESQLPATAGRDRLAGAFYSGPRNAAP